MCAFDYNSTFHFTKYLPFNTIIEFLVKERDPPNLVVMYRRDKKEVTLGRLLGLTRLE